MIRVLHTIDTTGPGGAETVFINLARGLDPSRFESVVAIRGPGWVCNTLRENGITPIFIPSQGRLNVSYLWTLIKIIRQYKINVIQAHLLGANLYSSLAGMICRIPVVATFHGFVDSSGEDPLIRLKSRLINRGTRKIVFVSDSLRQYFIDQFGFSAQKAVTIYNGVDTEKFYPAPDHGIRDELSLGPEHILIGAIGNIRPAKGYPNFLRAARHICDEHPECRFVIAGEGSGVFYKDLLALRNELELEDRFFFLGFRNDAVKILNNLDIFVLPSVSEGFSISTIEAMACDVPVIVTRSGGPEEIVSHEDCGLCVPCEPEGLADGVIGLVKDRKRRRRLSAAGHKKAVEKFSLHAMIASYQRLFAV